jgi:hypothetical protein
MRFPSFCARGWSWSARRASRAIIASVLIAGWPGRGWATVVFAPEFPPVSDLVGNYGVSYVYNNLAIALGNTTSQTSSDGDSKIYYPSSPQTFWTCRIRSASRRRPRFRTCPSPRRRFTRTAASGTAV